MSTDISTTSETLRGETLGARRPLSVTAEVFERGTSFPCKDVAVLRMCAPKPEFGEKPSSASA